MKVALLQVNSQDDKAENLRQVERLFRAAVAAEQPDMVALPEVFTFIGGGRETREAAAETFPDGLAYGLLRSLAAEHRVFVHGGSMFEREGERLYNTTVAFDRGGKEIARYRKIHLFDVTVPGGREYKESAAVGRGDEIVTYEAEGARIGCTICYDIRFPELYVQLMKAGTEVIMIPAAFTLQTGKDHWEVLCRARAIETQSYVVAPGQIGSHREGNGTRDCYGHSLVVDPWGHVIAKARDEVGFVAARLDLDYLRKVRRMLPSFAHHVL
ncbi:MAG: carbon-nitrogen hydrolase family protein [Alphaproteobacteria bacterium]|nr:carbon-nitrogen hydrolase family protein [Alphaproteobacteria bacterium]